MPKALPNATLAEELGFVKLNGITPVGGKKTANTARYLGS